MSIDLKALGSKLSAYRQQMGESIADLVTATGIDSVRLLGIETGVLWPTGDEILIIADHYRCDYKFFISDDHIAPFEQTKTLYRAHASDFSQADRQAVQDFLYLCETESFLMQELGRVGSIFSFQATGSNFKRNGEEAAAALRSTLGYSDREVPRDIYAEFRKVGVHMFRRKLGNSNISGLFIMHPIAGKSALVNHSEDIYRQRFSAAHEMAHAIFDADEIASVSYERINGTDLREVRANRFASCFLMPPAFLSSIVPPPASWSDADALHWANELRVSCQALGVALEAANLIDTQTSRRIQGLRVPRESKVDPELPASLSDAQRRRKSHLLELGLSDYYVGLCFDALHAGVISIGRASEALLCSQSELAELAKMYGRALHGDY